MVESLSIKKEKTEPLKPGSLLISANAYLQQVLRTSDLWGRKQLAAAISLMARYQLSKDDQATILAPV